jgi:type III secretion protein HrpB1
MPGRAICKKGNGGFMATLPKIVTPAKIENVLAFRTPQGAKNITAGQTEILGTVDTSEFDRIRLVADERIGSTCDVIVRMTIMEGNELVAFLDEVTLKPHSQLTRVYDLPATKLEVSIIGVGLPGSKGAVDVLIYGQF